MVHPWTGDGPGDFGAYSILLYAGTSSAWWIDACRRTLTVPTYPPAPGPRMAYDRNGSAGFLHDGASAPTQLLPAQMASLNDEADVSDLVMPAGTQYLAILFPQLRDLAAWGGRFGTQGTYVLQTSTDSTNGQNGTWTSVTGPVSNTAFDPANPLNRTTFMTGSVSGVSAVRFDITGLGADMHAYGVHLYGGISPGQTLDRLLFTDLFSNALLGSALDQGDVIQSSSADTELQVTNGSPTRTATDIEVFTEINTDSTPSVSAQYLVSTDGVNFAATITIPTLIPGQSAPIWLRRVTPSNAVLGSWCPRLVARAGAWN
jgi:hypothetical protein